MPSFTITRTRVSGRKFFSFLFSTFTLLYNEGTESGRHACRHVTQVCAHSKLRLANGTKLWIIHTAARNKPVAWADDFTHGSNEAVQNTHNSRLGWHTVYFLFVHYSETSGSSQTWYLSTKRDGVTSKTTVDAVIALRFLQPTTETCLEFLRPAFLKLWSVDHKWSSGSALVVLLDWILVQKRQKK